MLVQLHLLLVANSCLLNLGCPLIVHVVVEEVGHLLFKRSFDLLEHVAKVFNEDILHLVFIIDSQLEVLFSQCFLDYA